ncbi:hypothetical protein T01_383 [Trichinella spiralis]|uniref:Uncharacterized protein n=1 Tax=Trichinella spiralis TaxID=6334 RepID=A0A0V0ZZ99_TRISP|nr:hypothetical protein T01_383 [Trichinella spiralis]
MVSFSFINQWAKFLRNLDLQLVSALCTKNCSNKPKLEANYHILNFKSYR